MVTRKTEYANHRNRQIAYGQWSPWGDLEKVRAHIESLIAAGWTARGVARAAGVSEEAVRRHVRGVSKGIHAGTAQKILAVTDTTDIDRYMPTHGLGRRLRALASAGWPLPLVSEKTGLSKDTLFDIRADRNPACHPHTYRQIIRVYDELTAGMPPEPSKVVRHMKARFAHRWPNPWQWDDDLIDLPEDELAAELQRRTERMPDAELQRCARAYREGDISPLIFAGMKRYYVRKWEIAQERKALREAS